MGAYETTTAKETPLSTKPIRNISQMETALDDIIGAIQELEQYLDLVSVDDCITKLEDCIQSAQEVQEEETTDDADADSEDDSDED